MNRRLQQYLDDAREQIELVERNLLVLEQSDYNNQDIVNEIFRGIHTIKGGADFVGLDSIKDISHATEDILDLVRNKDLIMTREGIEVLLIVADTLKEMINSPDYSTTRDIVGLLKDINNLSGVIIDSDSDVKINPDNIKIELPLIPCVFTYSKKKLTDFYRKSFNYYIIACVPDRITSEDGTVAGTFLSELDEIGYVEDIKGPVKALIPGESSGEKDYSFLLFRSTLSKSLIIRYMKIDYRYMFSLRELERELDKSAYDIGSRREIIDTGTYENSITKNVSGTAVIDEDLVSSVPSGMSDTDNMNQLPSYYERVKTGNNINSPSEIEQGHSSNIRVNVEILDNLMNLAGELVLIRNQLNQNVAIWNHNAIDLASQRLDTITSEIQESIMATRMQPIGLVLSRFHRVIRDMSYQLQKSIRLVIEGEDVELDKSIIENIADPLTHLVRNAIDHGIEKREVRQAANKSETGILSIRSRHEAGHVVIEVSDDGKGIDTNSIKDIALRKGVIDRNRADTISEKELLRLIFTPGFSTVDEVSDISGRGVGMDVVFTNISRLGGSIDIDTKLGEGTSFKIKLPLTLAIVPSLLVSVDDDLFAIPQVNLVELVRLPPGQKTKIEYIGESAVFRLRNRLLPVIWLRDYLGIGEDDKAIITGEIQGDKEKTGNGENRSTNIVVVAAGDFHYGIVVNQLTDSEEIVVKPLGEHLRKCQGYAGATILGDGRAALILDIAGISESISVVNHKIETTLLNKGDATDNQNIVSEERTLIVENGEDEYFGIQLAYINRIERINENDIEKVANRNFIKYRGRVLKVFSLEDVLNVKPRKPGKNAYLVVFQMTGSEMAIVISDIIDIVDLDDDIDRKTIKQEGVTGSTIVLDHIVLLLDLYEFARSIDSDFRQEHTEFKSNEYPVGDRTVLVVEDSMFFQDKLETMLKGLGINVIVAADGHEGWDKLVSNANTIDLVLMDVEMPKMSGIELTKKLRSDPRFQDLPVVMLTSMAKESDIEKGKIAGANDYLIKMDEEIVKQNIFKHFGKTPDMSVPVTRH